jgi:DNA-binding response OmpR family regulator
LDNYTPMNPTKTILIVDDEESLVNVLARKFEEEGVNVLTAQNGKVGLEKALAEHPDLILLDIMMPEMDGFDVMRHLQEDEWGKTVPIILLTNSSSIETVAKAVSTGMSEFLVKTDMRLDDVVDRVRHHLG